MFSGIKINLRDTISVALETNGKGYLGFIVELPGAFIRGMIEHQALAKVQKEVDVYLKWLGTKSQCDYKIKTVQRHESEAVVEDGDTAILLQADKGEVGKEEFRELVDLARYSGQTFVQLYENTQHKEWVDESRIRKTFYGDNPATIQRIFEHVKNCQYYYLSAIGITEEPEEDFTLLREFALKKLKALFSEYNNLQIFEEEGELWTLKKVLRRFIWHDRIHAKAIARILARQRQLGVIDTYNDPFWFLEAYSG